MIEGFNFIGIELDEEGNSVEVGQHRIAHWATQLEENHDG